MNNTLQKAMMVGFAIGIFFSILAYLSDFPINHAFFWMIPFFAGTLSGVGTIVATFVSDYLASKRVLHGVAREILGFIAAAVVNTSIVLIILAYFGEVRLQRETIGILIIGLAMGGIYGIYSYRVERLNERMAFLEELADKNRQLQEASRKLAIIQERNRMGRELHDSVSQGLHGQIFTLHSLRNELREPNQRISDMLSHMEATANYTLDELRNMIEELKPSLLAEEGLEEALKVTASLFSQRQMVPIEMALHLPEVLSPDLEMTIYRIVQEALGNMEKHASPQHVFIEIISGEEKLLLTIKDDGKGFDRDRSTLGNGLKNMVQRAENIGGTLDIISKIGAGTSIIGRFPQKG